MLSVRKKLKGSNKRETIENYSMASVIFGALVFSGGVGLTALTPKGIPAIISMFGAVITFLSSVSLVFVWLGKEIFSKSEE